MNSTFNPSHKIDLVFVFLPFARIGSALSSNNIGQMRCAFGQMRRLTKRALHDHAHASTCQAFT